jgi:AcrR family transcriptional regulator
MAHRYDHLREKAIRLRTERLMTLEEIVKRLKLPKTTVYYWIRDIPIPRTEKQTIAQRNGTLAMQAKFIAIREQAYQQGLMEAPELLKDSLFRDFVVLYMAEGYKRNRNAVAVGNSDPAIVKLVYLWISRLSNGKISFQLQSHIDHDDDELKRYWADILDVAPDRIKISRKSNSGQLSGRQFRSQYGVLSVRVADTSLRARLQGWMDFVKMQW